MAKNEKSFTLIELMVVISVISLLASIIFVSMAGAREKAGIAKTLEWARSVDAYLMPDAIGFWTFNEGAGNRVNDISGYNHNGTTTGGVSWVDGVPGMTGKALQFDGSSGYVNVGNKGSLNASKQFTISLWFKVDNLSSPRNLFFRANRHVFYPRGWVNTSGVVSFQYRISGATRAISSTNKVSPGTWYHFAGTIDVASGGKLYINGEQWGSNGNTGTYIDGGTSDVLFGYDSNLGYRMQGVIDEVRIFSQAFTTAEIQKHYAEGLRRRQFAEK